jgi:RHS repeat-associated protein
MVVGWVGGSFALDDRALLWAGSGTKLPTFDSFSEALAVNRHGVATGYAYTSASSGTLAPVRWVGGQIELLGPLQDGRGTDINDRGEIVGLAMSGVFLWLPAPNYGLPAGFHDLRTVTGMPQPTGGGLQHPRINNDGVILVTTIQFGATNPWHWMIAPAGYVPPTSFPHDFLSADDEIAEAETEDPVNTLSGELMYRPHPDLDLGGPFPLRFERDYASGRDRGSSPGDLGNNWRHNFGWRVDRNGSSVIVQRGGGGTIRFTESAGTYTQVGELAQPWALASVTGGLALFDPAQQRIYTFDANGRLTGLADHRGRAHTLTYANDLLGSVSDGLGRTLTFVHDAGGQLTSVSDGTRSVRFSFRDGLLESATDVLGNTTRYEYDGALDIPGLMTRWVLPSGKAPWTHTYDAIGRVTSQTDPQGNALTLAWGLGGGQTRITNLNGELQTHVHNATGELASSTDGAGNVTTLGSDAAGRRGRIEFPGGAAVQVAYHPETGRIAKVTYPNARERTNTYAARVKAGFTHHDLASSTAVDGWRTEWVHDAAGRISSIRDGADATATFTWSSAGDLETATDPAGTITRFNHNSDGTMAWFELDGARTSFEYDALKRRKAVILADGTRREFTYDLAGNVLTATDERGTTFAFEYDGDGLLRRTGPVNGALNTLDYDPLGRLTSMRSASGALTTWTRDAAGRVSSATDATGVKVQYTRDIRGLVTEVIDGAGQTWNYAHDARGRPVSVTTPLGRTMSLTWNAMDSVDAITLANGGTVGVTRDIAMRETAITDALGNQTEFARDPRGLLSKITLPNGSAATYQRDVRGLLTAMVDPNGATWSFARNARGQVSSATDPLGRVTQSGHDARGRLTSLTYPSGAGSQTLTWDAAQNVTRRQFSDGLDLSYGFDARGRMTQANGLSLAWDVAGQLQMSNGIAAERDLAGRLKKLHLAAGKTVEYAYDAAGRLASVTDWLGGTTTFTRDLDGRVTGLTRPNSVSTSLGYDAMGRLTAIDEAGAFGTSKVALTRDAAGRITAASREVPRPPTLTAAAGVLPGMRSYDAAGQLTSVVRKGETVAVAYDALGRLTDDGTHRFSWDLASRVTGYVEGGQSVTFTYDGLGQVVGRTDALGARGYVWNHTLGRAAVSVELDGASDRTYYVHSDGGDLLYSVDAETSARRFFHFDELGSTLFLTGDDGQVTDTYSYAPYGFLLASSGSTPNPFTFVGQHGVMREGSSGLYRMGERLYDATTQRFLSRDPERLTHPRVSNPYVYAAANPLSFVDLEGRAPKAPPPTAGPVNLNALADATGTVGDITGGLEAITGVPANAVNETLDIIKASVEAGKGPGMRDTLSQIDGLRAASGKVGDFSEAVSKLGKMDLGEKELGKYDVGYGGKGTVDPVALVELGAKGGKAILESWKLTDTFKSLRSAAESNWSNAMREVNDALAKKLITKEQHAAHVRRINEAYELELKAAEDNYVVETLLKAAAFAQEALTDLLPDAVQWALSPIIPKPPE